MKKMNKFIKKFNKINLLVFIILYFLPYFLIIDIAPQQLSLTQVDPAKMFNSYFLYDSFRGIPQSGYENYGFILSKILGISLGMDWYDLCLTNDTNPPTKIGKIILPFGRNVTLSEIDAWRNRIPLEQISPESSINQVVADMLIANPTNIPTCTRISPVDMGFLYSGLFYYDEENRPVGVSIYGGGQESKTVPMLNGKNLNLGNSNFELKINKDALRIKRFVLFLALSALYLLILNMWSLIYKNRKEPK
jgi:hypothetical protein